MQVNNKNFTVQTQQITSLNSLYNLKHRYTKSFLKQFSVRINLFLSLSIRMREQIYTLLLGRLTHQWSLWLPYNLLLSLRVCVHMNPNFIVRQVINLFFPFFIFLKRIKVKLKKEKKKLNPGYTQRPNLVYNLHLMVLHKLII